MSLIHVTTNLSLLNGLSLRAPPPEFQGQRIEILSLSLLVKSCTYVRHRPIHFLSSVKLQKGTQTQIPLSEARALSAVLHVVVISVSEGSLLLARGLLIRASVFNR